MGDENKGGSKTTPGGEQPGRGAANPPRYPPYEVNISTLANVEQIEGKFGYGHPGSHSVVVKANSGKIRISYEEHDPKDLHPTLMVVISEEQ